MTRLAKKKQRREEKRAFKLVRKLGNSLDGLDASKVGDNAYLLENVLKRLDEEYRQRWGSLDPEELLAYHCVLVASKILSRRFGPDDKAVGLVDITTVYGRMYEKVNNGGTHMQLVKNGLRRVSEHMGQVVENAKWERYRIGGFDEKAR